MEALDLKVEKLDDAVRKHIELVESCLKEQENVVADQSRKIHQSFNPRPAGGGGAKGPPVVFRK